MGTKKRIFSMKVTNFLLKNGAELLEVRIGEVEHNPEACTFLFANDERLSRALIALKQHAKATRLKLK